MSPLFFALGVGIYILLATIDLLVLAGAAREKD